MIAEGSLNASRRRGAAPEPGQGPLLYAFPVLTGNCPTCVQLRP